MRDREARVKTVRQLLQAKGRAVVSIGPGASVFDALELMARQDVGAVVVLEDDRLIGLLSERDYARKVVLAGRASRDTRVAEIMAEEVVCVGLKHTLEGCMALMTDKRVRHLPVLDEGSLVGLVSIGDVVKHIIEDQRGTIEQLEHYIMGRG